MAALGGDAEPGGTRFDATQYAFFGNDTVGEVELGGLDEEEENSTIPEFAGIEEEYPPSYSDINFEGEVEGVDDLASTFSKLNRVVSDPRATIDSNSRSFSRESSAPSDFQQRWPDSELSQNNNINNYNNNNNHLFNSHPLNRAASYPQNVPQNFPTDPIPIPSNRPQNFTPALSPPNFMLRVPLNPNFPQNPNFAPNPNFRPSPPSNPNFIQNPNFTPNPPPNPNFTQNPPPNPNFTQNPSLRISSPPSNPNFAQNPNFRPSPPNPNFFPNPNSLLPPHMLPPQMFHPHHHQSPPHQIHPNPNYRLRPNYHNQTLTNPRKTLNISKYMTVDEIEHISRMQNALAHGSDPYIDDYYHQACLSKKSNGSGFKHHFCPTVIRDPGSRTRSRDEPHAFLQVEALGRLPFSSIRRPRPLLDVDLGSNNNDDSKPVKVKTLDQEPMLAARITIEDAVNLILDIDDIDRVLQFTNVPDNGFPLRRKRLAILEEIAGSLQLVDPLRPNTRTDDFVFLRISSLPKGRKLLSRYIQVLSGTVPGTENAELARVVCMAVFRHLRFLFGSSFDETLANTLCTTIRKMDLSSLSACLAAVVCSSEQPPLRPIGSASGSGASLALKTVLERATELLVKNAGDYNAQIRALWQASFDAFFNLLAKYCTGKYDSIVAQFGRIAGREIGREIPVELLRASLPHTDENQRRVLIDFAQRSLPVTEIANRPSVNGGGV